MFVQTPFVISVGPAAGVVQAELIVHQCALSYAMFLTCVEHTFEGVYRVPKTELNRTAASLLGSSYLPMPWWWQWVTIGMEYHHFHHVNPRVPCYRMKVREGSTCWVWCVPIMGVNICQCTHTALAAGTGKQWLALLALLIVLAGQPLSSTIAVL